MIANPPNICAKSVGEVGAEVVDDPVWSVSIAGTSLPATVVKILKGPLELSNAVWPSSSSALNWPAIHVPIAETSQLEDEGEDEYCAGLNESIE